VTKHDDEAKRPKEPDVPYIHPEKLGKPEHLKASLDDVVKLFEHGGTEEDEPDIKADTPAP
jgi:hypothetical protein